MTHQPPKSPTCRKQTSPALSKLASRILAKTKIATQADARKLAACVLSQDERKGD